MEETAQTLLAISQNLITLVARAITSAWTHSCAPVERYITARGPNGAGDETCHKADARKTGCNVFTVAKLNRARCGEAFEGVPAPKV